MQIVAGYRDFSEYGAPGGQIKDLNGSWATKAVITESSDRRTGLCPMKLDQAVNNKRNLDPQVRRQTCTKKTDNSLGWVREGIKVQDT